MLALDLRPVDVGQVPLRGVPVRAGAGVPGVVPGGEPCVGVGAPAVEHQLVGVAGPRRVVGARGREEHRVLVVGARVGGERRVVHVADARRVAVEEVGVGEADVHPVVDVVAGVEQHVGQLVGSHAVEGLLLQLVQQSVVDRLDVGGVTTDVEDVAVLRQPPEVRLDRPLERHVLADGRAVLRVARVGVAVEDEPPHLLRVQGRVDLLQLGAVGEPVEADLLLPQGPAEALEVADGVHRRRVRQQPALGSRRTRVRIALRLVEPVPLQRRRRGEVVGTVVAEELRVARQGRFAGPDSTRVEADPVVGQVAVAGHEVTDAVDREVETGGAGPARVGEHHALVVRVRRGVLQPRHPQRDLLPAGLVVVERHDEVRTLDPEGVVLQVRVGARLPVQRRRLVGAGRCLRGPGRLTFRGGGHDSKTRAREGQGCDGSNQSLHLSPLPRPTDPPWSWGPPSLPIRPLSRTERTCTRPPSVDGCSRVCGQALTV